MLTKIGDKHTEVSTVCSEAAFICSDLNYEGGDEILKECLGLADEEYEDIEDLKEALHDPICDLLYDSKVDMSKWDEYWVTAKAVKPKPTYPTYAEDISANC
jgi:hypothetical protein